ncbi:hypothetical protein E4191_13225 [Paracoccus liaowanqingii]|uniref:Uncharacterized protein n=1 Tax=Paracoccus liaowanqingii TaxID=2560053 RepID=A0A4P7HMS0_9RHOB|nr:hypothetical protein [Paracoccus liaowanqingii]QBX35549.1 hypothetical protein E4191_13225 [Paracoccus liaowanqingii]
MRGFDFSSWQGILTTVLGLALFAFIGVGIRVLVMLTIQQRQQRMNRQINERLRTLIAAYRTLGGSFTGELTVNPAHLRDLRKAEAAPLDAEMAPLEGEPASDRPRRIRDAVEAALADILLLGTDEHVRLAGQAAGDMAAGRPIRTAELVIALRDFIRRALDLEPIPASVAIPLQGPTRPQGGGGGRGGKAEGGRDRAGGGGGGGGGAAGGGGMGPIGMRRDDPAPPG